MGTDAAGTGTEDSKLKELVWYAETIRNRGLARERCPGGKDAPEQIVDPVDDPLEYEPRSLAISPSGRTIAIGTKAGAVVVYRWTRKDKDPDGDRVFQWVRQELRPAAAQRKEDRDAAPPAVFTDKRKEANLDEGHRAVRMIAFAGNGLLLVGQGPGGVSIFSDHEGTWKEDTKAAGMYRDGACWVPWPRKPAFEAFCNHPQDQDPIPESWLRRCEGWIPLQDPTKELRSGEVLVGLILTPRSQMHLVGRLSTESAGQFVTIPVKPYRSERTVTLGFQKPGPGGDDPIAQPRVKQDQEQPLRFVGGAWCQGQLWVLDERGELWRWVHQPVAADRWQEDPPSLHFDLVARIPLPVTSSISTGITSCASKRDDPEHTCLGIQAGEFHTVVFLSCDRDTNNWHARPGAWCHVAGGYAFALCRPFDHPPGYNHPFWMLVRCDTGGLFWIPWWRHGKEIRSTTRPIGLATAGTGRSEVLALAAGAVGAPPGSTRNVEGPAPFLVCCTRDHRVRVTHWFDTQHSNRRLYEALGKFAEPADSSGEAQGYGWIQEYPAIVLWRAKRTMCSDFGVPIGLTISDNPPEHDELRGPLESITHQSTPSWLRRLGPQDVRELSRFLVSRVLRFAAGDSKEQRATQIVHVYRPLIRR